MQKLKLSKVYYHFSKHSETFDHVPKYFSQLGVLYAMKKSDKRKMIVISGEATQQVINVLLIYLSTYLSSAILTSLI